MENLDRRDLFAALSALAALGAASSSASAAEPATLSDSKVIPYKSLAVRKFPNGGEQRRVMSGTLSTGEFIEVHETMLPAGEVPHPPHKHPNSEMLFIQTGSLEYDDDGKITPVGPGDIVFSASNKIHGLKNVGTTPATYIVFSVGKQLPEG